MTDIVVMGLPRARFQARREERSTTRPQINSIKDYLSKGIKTHTRCSREGYQEKHLPHQDACEGVDLDTYLFEEKAKNLSFKDRSRVEMQLRREIEELFHGRNLID